MSIVRALAKIKEQRGRGKNQEQRNLVEFRISNTPLVSLTIRITRFISVVHLPKIFYFFSSAISPNSVTSTTLPNQKDSTLGVLDYVATVNAIKTAATIKARNKYQRWSDKDRYHIGKYASENGTAAALRKYKTRYQKLNESTIRDFVKKYREELKKASKQNRSPVKQLATSQRGRPLMLGPIDKMVREFLLATRNQGGLVSTSIAVATAKALIQRYPKYDLGHIDLAASSWAKSLFKRMGFVRRMATSSKVEIPEGARKEVELCFMHQIAQMVETPQHSTISCSKPGSNSYQIRSKGKTHFGTKKFKICSYWRII